MTVAWIRDRALTLAMMAMFLLFLAGQMVTGFYEYNATQDEHGQARVTVAGYLETGHPWEALFENWESEFLQMAVFILVTTCLIQKGSPESRRPNVTELVDADPRDFADAPGVPWPVKRGGWILRIYENSLGLAFVLLFLMAWVGHAAGGFAEFAADEVTHGQARPTLGVYLAVAAVLVRIVPELAERVSVRSARWCGSPCICASGGRPNRNPSTRRTTRRAVDWFGAPFGRQRRGRSLFARPRVCLAFTYSYGWAEPGAHVATSRAHRRSRHPRVTRCQ